MDRINGADTIDIGGGRRGFRDENLVAGAAGTQVTALFLNMVQEEILKVVTEAGLVPSEGDWTQLWQALQVLGLAPDARSRRWLAVISMTLSIAPDVPSVGDTYLVPEGATGIWAAHVGAIAQWNGSAWSYLTPPDGHGISLPDGKVFERIAGIYVEKLALDAQSGKWNYAVAAGTANALTASLSPTPASLDSLIGSVIRLKIAANNTATGVTLNVNGLGNIPVYRRNSDSLLPNDIRAGMNDFVYDGTAFRLMTAPFGNSSIGTSGWVDLPGGLTMQWGGGSTTNGRATVTFPKAFSASPYSMCATDNGAGGWSTTNASFLGIGNRTATTAVISSVHWNGSVMESTVAAFFYMVIGPT